MPAPRSLSSKSQNSSSMAFGSNLSTNPTPNDTGIHGTSSLSRTPQRGQSPSEGLSGMSGGPCSSSTDLWSGGGASPLRQIVDSASPKHSTASEPPKGSSSSTSFTGPFLQLPSN